MRRGQIWWANIHKPRASEPGYRRPVLIVQADSFNASAINTVLVAVLTTNMRLANAPGNVRVSRKQSGLTKDSVINVSQLLTIDKLHVTEQVGSIKPSVMTQIDDGLRLVLSV